MRSGMIWHLSWESISMQTELALALRRVGDKIMECRRNGNTHGKWEGTQFKAAADMVADETLRSELQQIADIEVVSEEDVRAHSLQRPRVYWLIDPIDGTASFSHGFPGFVCQAALIRDGVPQLAGVFAPVLEKMYLAERGKGSTVNGKPMQVKTLDWNDLTLVDNYPQPRGVAELLFHNMNCSKYLESGSIGLKICLVAEGAADLFVKNVQVRDWDVAAPHLILEESGGILTTGWGEIFGYSGSYEKLGVNAASCIELLEKTYEIMNRTGDRS